MEILATVIQFLITINMQSIEMPLLMAVVIVVAGKLVIDVRVKLRKRFHTLLKVKVSKKR